MHACVCACMCECACEKELALHSSMQGFCVCVYAQEFTVRVQPKKRLRRPKNHTKIKKNRYSRSSRLKRIVFDVDKKNAKSVGVKDCGNMCVCVGACYVRARVRGCEAEYIYIYLRYDAFSSILHLKSHALQLLVSINHAREQHPIKSPGQNDP